MKTIESLILFVIFFIISLQFKSISLAYFNKNHNNPVFDFGTNNGWDSLLVNGATIAYDGQIYRMWYTGYDGITSGKIGLALSINGINWTRYQNNPVISPTENNIWEHDLGEPTVIVSGNNYSMWYTSFNFLSNEPYRIRRAVSNDGITWSKSTGPVLTKTNLNWEDRGVGNPYVIFHNGEYKMWYAANHSDNKWRIGYASSSDGNNWSKNEHPVLTPDLPWEGMTVAQPSVIFKDGLFHMFYHAGPVVPKYIGHATSLDGIVWNKEAQPILFLGGFTDFDRTYISSPDILLVNNKLLLYYSGYDGVNWRIGVAEELQPVPYFSQKDPQWGGDEYDDANSWAKPESRTISAVGCALTSAAMVLKHFNVYQTPGNLDINLPPKELNPGTLNEWMKSKNDSYFRNGAVNWALIANMTKKSHELDPVIPKLEYYSTSSAQIAPTLSTHLPVILNLDYPSSPSNSHYVVATESAGTTFSIQDPYYANRTTLEPYYSTINTAGYYKPTNSDFSFMIFAIDPAVSLKLMNSNDQLVGDEYIQKPIIDLENQTDSGAAPLKIVQMKSPPPGTYTLKLSSNNAQPYQLDSYMYTVNGEGEKNTVKGVVSNTDIDSFTITINTAATSSATLVKSVGFDTLIQDLLTAQSLLWIPDKELSQGWLAKARTGKKLAVTDKMVGAKMLLKTMLLELNLLENKINTQAYELLTQDIQSLLTSL